MEMYREGYINHIPLLSLEVRNKVDAYMRQGLSHGQAVRHMAGEIGVSRVTIYSYL